MLLRDKLVAGISSALFICTISLAAPAAAEGDPQSLMRALNEARVSQQSTQSVTKTKDRAGNRQSQKRGKAETRVATVPSAPAQAPIRVSVAPTVDVAAEGNNGELRSNARQLRGGGGFFRTIFGEDPPPDFLPETRTLDTIMSARAERKPFAVKPEFVPQSVAFSGYPRGTIVVDTASRFLYLVEGRDSARRYAIAVGKEGLAFKGTTTVGDKQEWPRWFPTKEMQEREPKKYGPHKDGMNGGPDNPLGARAIYLYQDKTDTHIRIHGTNAPSSIGSATSNGCFRMINEHVIDLYNRVKVGTEVVVL